MKSNFKNIRSLVTSRLSRCTVAILTVLSVSILPAVAVPVTFWFSGSVNYVSNPSNALPAAIAIGTPFSGRITYDTVPIGYSEGFLNDSGSRSNIYFSTIGTASTLLQIGGHTLTNALVVPGGNTGSLHINDNFDNEDFFMFYTGQSGLIVDGHPLTNSLWSIYLKDASKTAYNSATFPTNVPSLAAFPSKQEFSWALTDDAQNTVFYIAGEITNLSTNKLVTLNLRRAANNLEIGWPVGVSGFALQSCTNLAAANWQNVTNPIVDVGMEHTVTLNPSANGMFFRLKAP